MRFGLVSRSSIIVVISALVLLTSQAALYHSTAEKERATQWVSHTYEVIQQLSAVESGLALAEAAVRGLALSHDSRLVPTVGEGIARARRGLAEAQRLTGDNPAQQHALATLAPHLDERARDIARSLAQLQRGESLSDDTASASIATSQHIRAEVAALTTRERELLGLRLEQSRSQTQGAERVAFASAAVAFAICCLIFWLSARHTTLLREAEEELRLTIENAPRGMALVSPDGRWLRVNQALCQILGADREALVGTPIDASIPAEDRPRERTRSDRLLAGAVTASSGERRLVRADGSIVWVEEAISLVRSIAGRPRFFVLQLEDITERRAAEAEARIFFEHSVDLLAISVTPGKLDRVNAAWERTLGWSRAELTTKPYTEFLHPEDAGEVNAQQAAFENPGPASSFRNRYRMRSGNYRWLDWRVYPAPHGGLFCIARDVTEQVEREQELNVFSRALAAAPSGVIMTNHAAPDEPIAYVNPAFERMTEYAPHELIGKSCRILQGTDRDQPEIAQLRRAIVEERECQVVLRNYKKSGEMFLNAVSISPVRDTSGRLTHFVGIAEDITGRKREEEQARLLALLTRVMTEAKAVDYALETVLQSFCLSQGYEYGEIWLGGSGKAGLARPACFAVDRERTRRLRAQADEMPDLIVNSIAGRVWRSGQPEWHCDVRAVPPEAFLRREAAVAAGLYGCIAVPLLGRDRVEGVLLVLRSKPVPQDERMLHLLTTIAGQLGMLIGRRRAEEALRASEERLSYASKATSDVVYDWDVAHDALWFAEGMERNFGHPAGAVELAWWTKRIHPDDLGNVERTLHVALEGSNDFWSAEYRFQCGNGSYADIFDRAFILRDAAGKPTRIIGSMMDITERVRTQNALREAKEAAEAAGKAKTTFLAHMSHEIRTPLTALLGFADLLLDPKLGDSDRVNYALTIRRNGEHLLSVLNDILDVSIVEAGKLTIEPIPFSPANVLTEVASLMRARALGKGLAFGIQYETPIPTTVRGDPTRIRQILLNLVSNAVKFTQHGSVKVGARCERSAEGSELVISVQDTGIGIDDAQLQRIFKPFSQADASMTRRFGGSGLGLAICAPLAQAMGGSIGVESAPRQGSVFTFKLPVEILPGSEMINEPREALAVAGGDAGPTAAGNLSGNVLLAEDGYDNQQLIGTILRRQGFHVTVVANGLDAVNRALLAVREGEPFDFILMDMQMPELDGYGATARLRAAGYRGPIIALTAHAMAGERERCITAGCNEYLSKPIDRSALTRAVTKYARAVPVPADPMPMPMPLVAANQNAPSQRLLSEYADDPEIGSLVVAFVSHLPETLAAIEHAAARDDRAQLKRLSHQLKGAAGGYGFPQITAAAGHLEQLVNDPSQSYAAALVELSELCHRTQPEAALASARPSKPTLLVIDDSEETQALVAARLASEAVKVTSAPNAVAGIALAREQPPDLILLDLDLPDIDGFNVCRELKSDPRTADVPVLFLTGTEESSTKATAFELGAVDYVTKPFDAIELRARVRAALRTKRYQDLLTTRAQVDGLTGLWNRTYFEGRIKEEISAALRYDQPLSLAMIDIDHFKRLNDSHGHPLGDRVLQLFAAALQRTLRVSDIPCRYGGEEFAVILRQTGKADSVTAGERIRRVVADLALTHNGADIRVTASVGVASVGGGEARVAPSQLVEAADAALYRAKHAGRNQVMLGEVRAA